MHLNTLSCSKAHPAIYDVEDPLAHDDEDDIVVTTTRRAISRVAFVAAETASRFEREAIEHDPMAWLFSPRRLFGGRAAIDACLDHDGFQKAIILHGLSLGLDADPEDIDELLDDDELDDDAPRYDRTAQFTREHRGSSVRLFSATIDHQLAGKVQHGFHASMAGSMTEFRSRVASIFGSGVLPHAVLREGVNPSVRLVEGLVSSDALKALISVPDNAGRRVAVTAERVVELDS